MAGLGGMCSHTASILFYLETTIRIQGVHPTCTQEKCEWIIPSYLKTAEYLPLTLHHHRERKGNWMKLLIELVMMKSQSHARGKESTDSEMET